MEILDDRHNYSNFSRLDIQSNEIDISQSIIERIMYFFSITKEERFRAGIFVGKEGREWLENAPLTLPTPEYWE